MGTSGQSIRQVDTLETFSRGRKPNILFPVLSAFAPSFSLSSFDGRRKHYLRIMESKNKRYSWICPLTQACKGRGWGGVRGGGGEERATLTNARSNAIYSVLSKHQEIVYWRGNNSWSKYLKRLDGNLLPVLVGCGWWTKCLVLMIWQHFFYFFLSW